MSKYLKQRLRQYIFIIFTATILLTISFSKAFPQENIFTVEEVVIKGLIEKNFNRDNYINRALNKSFKMLMSKILVSSDLTKIKNIKTKDIKYLVNSFQVLDEDYYEGKYEIKFKIFFNEKKIKDMLIKKRISYFRLYYFPETNFFSRNRFNSASNQTISLIQFSSTANSRL